MKLYVANKTQSEKMVYLSCVRYIKENGKFHTLSFDVSVKKENYHLDIKTFPVVADVTFKKGVGAIVNNYEKV